MFSPEVELSVSIVSYRAPGPLRACLDALAAERDHVDLDVTVVDNAPGDGSAEMVKREFPWVRLIGNARNVGFGAAHNQVLREAHGRYWLILNSDTAVQLGALATLVAAMDAQPDVAVAGPKLRHPSNSILSKYYVKDRSDDEAQDVDWLSGACLCVRASAAQDVGLFDERFFMYSEELDWCRRFRAAGWRVSYVPSAEVIHLEGASSRLDLAARDRLFQSSKLAYAEKWHGPAVALALRAYMVLEYVARAAEESVKLAIGSRVPERRARLRIIGSGLRSALLRR